MILRLGLRQPHREHWTKFIYVHGVHGCGKSCAMKLLLPGATYVSKNANFFDGFSLTLYGNRIIIFDDFDKQYFSNSIIKKLGNHIRVRLNVKNGSVELNAAIIVFISNESFNDWGLSASARSRFQGKRGIVTEFKRNRQGFGRIPLSYPSWAIDPTSKLVPGQEFPFPHEPISEFMDRAFGVSSVVESIIDDDSDSSDDGSSMAVPSLGSKRLGRAGSPSSRARSMARRSPSPRDGSFSRSRSRDDPIVNQKKESEPRSTQVVSFNPPRDVPKTRTLPLIGMFTDIDLPNLPDPDSDSSEFEDVPYCENHSYTNFLDPGCCNLQITDEEMDGMFAGHYFMPTLCEPCNRKRRFEKALARSKFIDDEAEVD